MLTPVWRDFLALASLSSLSEEHKSSTKDLKDSGRDSISSPSSVSNQAKSKCGDGALHDVYSVFQGFSKAKFANGGSILSSSQFLILSQLAQKMKLTSKVVKFDSKIIISLPKI